MCGPLWRCGLVLLVCMVCIQVQAGLPVEDRFHVRFEPLKARAGVNLGYIDAIIEDSMGFIWMGGENGLVRYDGYEFKVFRNQPGNPNSLSSNNIWDIDEDENQDLWIATEGGINRFDRVTGRFSHYKHDPLRKDSLNHNNVRSLTITRAGMILVGTFGGGAALLEPRSGRVTRLFPSAQSPVAPIRGSAIWEVFQDASGDFWFGSEGAGASHLDPATGKVTRYHSSGEPSLRIESNTVRAVAQDDAGDIWLGTDAGLYRIHEGVVTNHWREGNGPEDLGSNIIWDVFQDRNGDMWVATDGGGLNLIHQGQTKVRHFTHDRLDSSSISSNVVRKVIEDRAGDIWTANFPSGASIFHRAAQWAAYVRYVPTKAGRGEPSSVPAVLEGTDNTLWVGTDGDGLRRIDSDGTTTHFTKGEHANSISGNAILALAKDDLGNIWAGTWGHGVNLIRPDGEVIQFGIANQAHHGLSHPNVWAILVDRDGDVWLGTEGGGLNRYDAEAKQFIATPLGELEKQHSSGLIIWSIFQDHAGYLWIGTNSGLIRYDKKEGTSVHWQQGSSADTLSNNSVLSIFEDRKQRLWVGTRAGLNRMRIDRKGFDAERAGDGVASGTISSILEDDRGFLWLGTNDGLVQLDPDSLSVRSFSQSDWAGGKFSYGSALKLESGELIFGGIEGYVRFTPDRLQSNDLPPPVVLTDFQVLNQTPKEAVPGSVLPTTLSVIDHIRLDYTHSVFSFEFAALNYYGTENNQYAYKLVGFDRDWNYIGHQRKATYTNIPAGEYRLKVKASNNDGVWNHDGLTIRLSISPAPWLTWWAYLIYVFCFSVIVWSYIRMQMKKIAQERSVNERLRELDKLKDDFLANTSHELRTPLNGMVGLAESLEAGAAGEVSDPVRMNLRMIIHSGKRLASLVNDILDFSSLKHNNLRIHPTPLNLRQQVDTVAMMSRSLIGMKDLDVTNVVDEFLPAVLADENRLQQILYNLIGNAIKFTDSGVVTISARVIDGTVEICIRDTGVGIDAGKLGSIFESFEQCESHFDRQYNGAGLGLAVTKELVELHGGSIWAESTAKVGSSFYFTLPITDATVAYGQMLPNTLSQAFLTSSYDRQAQSGALGVPLRMPSLPAEGTFIHSGHQFRILIVDDEAVNRHVLVNHLSLHHYRIVEAASGRDALETLDNQGPFDLVLLDIMMPRMSGYEVCARIRKTHPIADLPIIFLTAKNLISDLVDGFDVGANDFLSKPVSKGELLSRVRTHLQLLDVHRHLENKIRERTQAVEQANTVLETLDGIVATINQEVIFERLVDVLLREACRLFSAADRAIYWSYDQQAEVFEPTASYGYHSSQLQSLKIDRKVLFDRYCRRTMRIEQDIYILSPNKKTAGNSELRELPLSQAELVLAVSFDDVIVGFLSLINLSAYDAFSQYDVDTIVRFHAHIKSALLKGRLMETMKAQNTRLEDSSLSDPLTGLRNRRYLSKYLDSDIALTLRSHRGRSPGAPAPENSDLLFFILDVDGFKLISEQHGHAAGDRVLMQIKELLAQVFRESDFLVRWGGDEFLMAARFSNRSAAPLMAERLRQTIAEHQFDIGNGQSVQRTCSIGFACFPFLLSDPLAFSWQQVVDIADMCLHTANRSGRDGWVGLEANAGQEHVVTFSAIAATPKALIDGEQLLLHTSIKTGTLLKW